MKEHRTNADIRPLHNDKLTRKQLVEDMQDLVGDIRNGHSWDPEEHAGQEQKIITALSGIMLILEEIEKKLTE